MPWPQTGASHYRHAQLEFQEKGRAIKGIVVCNVVWPLARIYDKGDGYLNKRKVRGLLWSRWLSSSSTATPPLIHTNTYHTHNIT